MTPKELGELGHLTRATPIVDAADLPHIDEDAALEPGLRKSVAHLRAFAEGADPDGRIAEQFRIIHFSGWAPHPDQPRPARRGSGTASLIDALSPRP